jgi:cysteine synthase
MQVLKARKPNCQVIAVEPASSPLLSTGVAGPNKIQGIGPNFVPKILDRSAYARVMPITFEDAIAMQVRLIVSSGCVICGCVWSLFTFFTMFTWRNVCVSGGGGGLNADVVFCV